MITEIGKIKNKLKIPKPKQNINGKRPLSKNSLFII